MANQKKRIEPLPIKRTVVPRELCENIEKAVQKYGGNKYEMTLLAAYRARQISKGAAALLKGDHKSTVTAILEIETGLLK